MAKPKQIRCAIYTRKSTEEGLEQEFNSLDAQREACAAYVLSQRHEGWTLLPNLYDDGGFSGGNMERRGLKQLLADVALGKIDVIVVYKVDRLTRSLPDFSKIVEVLEKTDTSFVSVTQAFNTTTSMGRLMLNVLLSFAQFEREVTGERIRDKIAASKRKGMWMGGPVPLGYVVSDRKLVPEPGEAATVRLIFELYCSLRSVRLLVNELARRRITTKQRIDREGRTHGGIPFGIGPLSHLLRNPVYIGEVRHKDERFPGEHAAIIDRALWDEAQAILSGLAPADPGSRLSEPSLLVGRLSDGKGRPMTPSHGTKGTRRYRYYITRTDQNAGRESWRVPAATIDSAVLSGLQGWLASSEAIAKDLSDDAIDPTMIAHAKALGTGIGDMTDHQRRSLLNDLRAQVTIGSDAIALTIGRKSVLKLVGSSPDDDNDDRIVTITIPARITRRGCEMRLAYPADDQHAPARIEPGLVKLIAEAEHAYAILTGPNPTSKGPQRDHHVRISRLKFLAPDIIAAILEGRQPVSLNRQHLIRAATIPLDWGEQRRVFGFG
jgi:site-specific DNA recombinase